MFLNWKHVSPAPHTEGIWKRGLQGRSSASSTQEPSAVEWASLEAWGLAYPAAEGDRSLDKRASQDLERGFWRLDLCSLSLEVCPSMAELGPVGQETFTSFPRLIAATNEKPNSYHVCDGLATGWVTVGHYWLSSLSTARFRVHMATSHCMYITLCLAYEGSHWFLNASLRATPDEARSWLPWVYMYIQRMASPTAGSNQWRVQQVVFQTFLWNVSNILK